jgi:hypothetical protein
VHPPRDAVRAEQARVAAADPALGGETGGDVRDGVVGVRERVDVVRLGARVGGRPGLHVLGRPRVWLCPAVGPGRCCHVDVYSARAAL